MSEEDEVKEVRKALTNLENLPKELEETVNNILTKKGIVTLVDAEDIIKRETKRVFGDKIVNELEGVVRSYLVRKHQEIKEKIHDAVTSRKDYLNNLLLILEDPKVTDESFKYTYSFGGGKYEVPTRQGLEVEVLTYLDKHPDKYEIALERSREWINGDYDDLVKSSGYRFIGDSIEQFEDDKEKEFQYVLEIEEMFLNAFLNNDNERIQDWGLGGVCRCMVVRHCIEKDDYELYKPIFEIADKKPHHRSYKDINNVLSIIFPRGKYRYIEK